jgi:hypothetical protein
MPCRRLLGCRRNHRLIVDLYLYSANGDPVLTRSGAFAGANRARELARDG